MNIKPDSLPKNDLLEIAQKWQEKLNLTTNRIQIMKMKNKWSSCSTNGNITLNSELTQLSKELAEYAILHELLHLIVPNHGKTFKALLSAYMPNWQELHNQLAQLGKSQSKTVNLHQS